jgi:uncharacterized membrane protein
MMKFTKTALVAEIVGLLVVLVVVEWLSTVFLHTRAFWPLMIYAAIYLCVRVALLARKARAAPRSRNEASTKISN